MVGRDISKSHAINRVRGITPTFTDFDTNPATPENMIDGDFTTESGEGVKTLAAPAAIGNITFDMGVAYPVLIISWVNAHRASGDGVVNAQLHFSNDNITWWVARIVKESMTADNYRAFDVCFIYARYFRFYFYSTLTTVPSEYHVKVAEIQALQLKI